MKKILAAIVAFLWYKHSGDALFLPFIAGWSSVTYTFTPSTTIKSSEVNQNFTDLVNAIDKAMPSSASGHGIIMWSGSIANIPSGWYLCDGSNGTPDLRGKFVLGAGGSYSVSATGGEETHTLTTSELAVHSHNIYADTSYYIQGAKDGGTQINPWASSGNGYTKGGNVTATQNSGSGSAHNNMPPYMALAFIMKS